MKCDPEFLPLLTNYSPESLGTSSNTIYGVRADLSLAYFNDGWTQFSIKNGGGSTIGLEWCIGRNIQEAVPSGMRPFFREHFAKCQEENVPWEYEYDCSSPTQCRRALMRVYPLTNFKGFLIENSHVLTSLGCGAAREQQEKRYRTSDGFIIQCCRCLKVQRLGTEQAWDRVSEWKLRCPPYTSHGICEACFGFYYGSNPQAGHSDKYLF